MTTQKSDGVPRVPVDTLAARLLLLRHELGMSRKEAAALSGVPIGTWQGMEEGRNSRGLPWHINKIAQVFGYDRDWLLWGGPLAPGGADLDPAADGTMPDTGPVNNRYLTHDSNVVYMRRTA